MEIGSENGGLISALWITTYSKQTLIHQGEREESKDEKLKWDGICMYDNSHHRACFNGHIA